MTLADLDGRLVQVNQAFADCLGTTPALLVGRALHELTHPDDLAGSQGAFARLSHPTAGGYQLTKRIRHASGRWITVQLDCHGHPRRSWPSRDGHRAAAADRPGPGRQQLSWACRRSPECSRAAGPRAGPGAGDDSPRRQGPGCRGGGRRAVPGPGAPAAGGPQGRPGHRRPRSAARGRCCHVLGWSARCAIRPRRRALLVDAGARHRELDRWRGGVVLLRTARSASRPRSPPSPTPASCSSRYWPPRHCWSRADGHAPALGARARAVARRWSWVRGGAPHHHLGHGARAAAGTGDNGWLGSSGVPGLPDHDLVLLDPDRLDRHASRPGRPGPADHPGGLGPASPCVADSAFVYLTATSRYTTATWSTPADSAASFLALSAHTATRTLPTACTDRAAAAMESTPRRCCPTCWPAWVSRWPSSPKAAPGSSTRLTLPPPPS